jgi:hypothetical protein
VLVCSLSWLCAFVLALGLGSRASALVLAFDARASALEKLGGGARGLGCYAATRPGLGVRIKKTVEHDTATPDERRVSPAVDPTRSRAAR